MIFVLKAAKTQKEDSKQTNEELFLQSRGANNRIINVKCGRFPLFLM